MKNKLLHLLALFLITPAFTSCSLFDGIFNSRNGGNSSSYVPDHPAVEGNGYYKPKKLAYKATDYDPSFSPSSGELNILIIPIQFKSALYTLEYTDEDYKYIDDRYFGFDADSLRNYYYNASFGKLDISGEIAETYVTTLSAATVNGYDSRAYNSFLTKVYEWTLSHNPSLDFSKFDSNNDGLIDSVHFITNLKAGAFNRNLSPNGYLWPHMSYIGSKKGTHERPNVDVYLSAPYGEMDGTTSIHEQGHVFGVEDYYNYTSGSKSDFIGGADMQDLNCFDWNSYSKMLMDWTQPYVIDGKADSVTLTIKPASTSGDCILIPTSSWNGSAYDEFILLELFTKSGNNELYWDDWTTTAASYGNIGAAPLGDGGVRMFHVDSRLFGFDEATANNTHYVVKGGSYITNPTTTTYHNVCLPQTNSTNHVDYTPYVVSEAKNYKLLSVVQAGKLNTFKTGSRNALIKQDLFQTGNVFNMKSYSSFFINGRFNNGDECPYTITFNSVTAESATITISK